MCAEPAAWPTPHRPSPPRTWSELVRRIGDTPLVPIGVEVDGKRWTVLLKLESANPFGSIKDRTAYGLIRSLEVEHASENELTIVESTSGNLGAALAQMCRLRGHQFIAVVDPKVVPANLALIKAAGARIELVSEADETGNYLAARIARVQEICAATSVAHWSNQYARAANPRVHYLQTGPEILRQAGGNIDLVVVAVSTGGTLSGIATFMRSASPGTTVIGVDVEGSVALGGRPSTRWLTGIGANRRSHFVGDRHLDERTWVADALAIAICRKLHNEAGLYLGGSSGAVLAACISHLRRHTKVRRAVCVCPDDGAKYRESLYDDGWVRDREIDLNRALEKLAARGLRFMPVTE